MRKILLTTAAALSIAAIPAMSAAQQSVPSPTTNTVPDKRDHYRMTPEQQVQHDAWPAERQADYGDWAPEYQTYYWSLTPDQQDGYWILTPDQRVRIYDMTPADRSNAWDSIAQQMGAAKARPQTRTNPDLAYETDPVVQPAPQAQPEYPVCKGEVQDSCINPREAGLAWGNRPLDYWPGKPASEL